MAVLLSPPSHFYSPSASSAFVVRSKKKSESKKVSGAEPPRITSNVKRSLQLLRSWKEIQKRNSGGAPKPATSYRKKKGAKELVSEDELIYEDPSTSLYSTNQWSETVDKVLLVDGYNVCGYWDKLKTHFANGRLEIARQMLIDELTILSSVQEIKVVVVFDALSSGLPTHKETQHSIDVVFPGDTSADTWIEKQVEALKEDGCPTVLVATSDIYLQQAAYGLGAFIRSCKGLISEIHDSQSQLEENLQKSRFTVMQGRMLKHNIAPTAFKALKDLRKQLAERESP